ncbi:CKLF-like MARVEL transmembrane domain-containing protein 6 isoform X2 [Myiozetetes cayanensis]|uniref:CKLF-like MARVEL transmembrane domain-containing protein 6 isoform X2 n=1 Tax=Myiozetetes cayanensis TaxID=478635 RepID=UPI00215DE1A4|nr:CKLF-like MARVEL transmembrane domain-containing protein 6 isoform X2 [Myiozetetes cayanensis]
MENGAVYNETTEPEAKPSRRRSFGCTLRHLPGWRLPAKAVQALFSFAAVICEEIVEDCSNCGGLYFFEFTSCSAFLLSLLVLCVYCTDVYETLGEDKVEKLNFWAMPVIAAWFLIASIVFAVTSSGSAIEHAACVSLKIAGFTLYLSDIWISCKYCICSRICYTVHSQAKTKRRWTV